MNTDKLREFCLSLPASSEGIKWDHLCFMVAEKLFVITSFEDDSTVNFKVTEEDFDTLTEREGIAQAYHMGKRKWIGVSNRSALSRDEWKQYLRKSYDLVKSKLTKKLQQEIDEAG